MSEERRNVEFAEKLQEAMARTQREPEVAELNKNKDGNDREDVRTMLADDRILDRPIF